MAPPRSTRSVTGARPNFDSLTEWQRRKAEAWKRRALPETKKIDSTPFKYDERLGADGEMRDVAFPR